LELIDFSYLKSSPFAKVAHVGTPLKFNLPLDSLCMMIIELQYNPVSLHGASAGISPQAPIEVLGVTLERIEIRKGIQA
jgi:hypothetical protein